MDGAEGHARAAGDPDDTRHDPAPAQVWAAPPAAVGLAVLAAVAFAVWALAVDDPPGRLLVGLAAVALLGAAGVAGIARPRLAAGPDGVTLRGVRGARRWPWSRIDAVRTVRMRRLGMPATFVEIDARDDGGGSRLLVLGRLELGVDPVDAAADLQHHRARAGRRADRARGRTGARGDGSGGDGSGGDVERRDTHRGQRQEQHDDAGEDGEPQRGT